MEKTNQENTGKTSNRKRIMLTKVYSTDGRHTYPVAKIAGKWLATSGFKPGDEVVISNPEHCTVVMHLSDLSGAEHRKKLLEMSKQKKVDWALHLKPEFNRKK